MGCKLEGKTVVAIIGSAVVQHRVDALQALDRFAQRSGGQATLVAQAASGVDQHQFQVPSQPVMLHTVVGQDQVQRLTRQQAL